jgi:tRNA pseudouridine13 synthase
MPTIPDWTRAHGIPEVQGHIRQSASDFEVTEILEYELSGDGEHDYLWLEKEDANTAWVAGKLARHAGVREADVGFAGMKDRHARTRQWFSVRRPSAAGTNWNSFDLPDARILKEARHDRKLRRGAHSGNKFRIALRNVTAPGATIDERLELVRASGVPNYFGEQRFGHDGSNLQMASELFAGKRMSRNKRGIALSAARSFLFNHILERRVVDRNWDQLVAGECACLDGSNSIFVVDEPDQELLKRCAEMDVHPGGALWGKGEPACRGAILSLEQSVVALFSEYREGLESHMQQSRRALRLAVRDLNWRIEGQTLWLEFRLTRGGYATAVLREIAFFLSRL